MAGKTQADERDFTAYADKVPTGTMEAFADWIIDEVFGGEFPGTQKDEKAFRQGVQLGGTLRMEFQASEYWKTDERNPRSANGKAARAPKPAATGRGRGKAADTEDDDEAPTKATTSRRGGAKPATGTKTGTTRGKPAARGGAKPGATTRRRGTTAKESSGEAPY